MRRLVLIPLCLALVLAAPGEGARSRTPHSLVRAFMCIYRHENGGFGWKANTGNGYYGGLQMDRAFQRDWGAEFYREWGTADRWPREVQLAVAIRAWFSRGWTPWPTTSRLCGLR